MSYVDRIARLRIVLDDTEPVVWRSVEVPLTISLKGLHEVIQAAMPFEDYHLFDFRIGEMRYAMPDPDWPGPDTRSAKAAKLGAVLETGIRQFGYTYDFGDNWQHSITVEEIGPADPAAEYPRYVDGERRAPPEDVGGTFGFDEFLDAMSKPRHRERKRLLDWYGGPFDPEAVDSETIRAKMGELAKRRAVGMMGFARSRGSIQ
jgi:hypothetical protein